MLIFVYSGWRISELLGLKTADIGLQARTMKGGTKTKTGKNRLVPMHSLIRSMVERRMADYPIGNCQIYWQCAGTDGARSCRGANI